jgi:hypothetical protein
VVPNGAAGGLWWGAARYLNLVACARMR